MQELIKRTYWWPGLKEDIKKYVQGCAKCQQNKVQHQRKAGELHPLEIPEGPWHDISIDIIRPLPRSNGMDAIVVIVDQFTKMIRLKATTTNISLEGIAKIYRDDIWKIHGVPRTILSDHSLHRNSWKTLLKYWKQKENYLQRITLKPMDKQKESTRK